MRNGSLWINVVFEKEVISHSNIERLQVCKCKRTNLCNKGVLYFTILMQLRWPIESKFSEICYLFAYVWTHQVRIPVFDNLAKVSHWPLRVFYATCMIYSNTEDNDLLLQDDLTIRRSHYSHSDRNITVN